MKLLKTPIEIPENTALQQAVDTTLSTLSNLEERCQELTEAKKHLISDKNRPFRDSIHSGTWCQKQRQSRIGFRFAVEALLEALAELKIANNALSQAIEAAKQANLSMKWEQVLLADSIGSRAEPGFKTLALNVLISDELRAKVADRLYKEHQYLKQVQSQSPDNFHRIWDLQWLDECLRLSKRQYTCRYRHIDSDEWQYLPSAYSDYLYSHGQTKIPATPCMTWDEAIAVSEQLLLEIWQNWGTKNLLIEIYDIARSSGHTHPMSESTIQRLFAPPAAKQAQKKQTEDTHV